MGIHTSSRNVPLLGRCATFFFWLDPTRVLHVETVLQEARASALVEANEINAMEGESGASLGIYCKAEEWGVRGRVNMREKIPNQALGLRRRRGKGSRSIGKSDNRIRRGKRRGPKIARGETERAGHRNILTAQGVHERADAACMGKHPRHP